MNSPVVILLFVLVATGSALARPGEFPGVVGRVPDRLLVTLAPGVVPDPAKAGGPDAVGIPALDAVARRHRLRRIAPLFGDMAARVADAASRDLLAREYAVDLAPGTDLEAAKAAYGALPQVAFVREVAICRLHDAFLPDDPNLAAQWYLRNTSYGPDIRAVGAWGHARGDSGIVVAVIDTGVDWHHPDLGGSHPDRVNGAVWTNWTEYGGAAGVDDDGNGYVDDIRGWDWVDVGDQGWPGQDDTVADNDPADYAGHGTNCAGCIAPLTDNGVGVAAAAPGVKIMALRTGYLPAGSSQAVVRMDYCAQAMVYAALNGARIINASWGSTDDLASAVATCQAYDVLIVNSAGNDNSDEPDFLGNRAGVLAVAATDHSDGKAIFSNFGHWVELAAPGVDIFTTHYDRNTSAATYLSVQGTSFAAPIVAGGAALVWSANPGLTYQQISAMLLAACDDLDARNPGYAGRLGAGRLNLLRVLGDDMHRYPEEFPTLYDAMNSAGGGDTVGVLGGEVLSDIASIPDGVKLFGGYSTDYASRDPVGDPSVIQGAPFAPAVEFLDAGPDTELDGFRIQGGRGRVLTGVPFTARCGGGVLVLNASPTLRHLLITGNGLGTGSEPSAGGGIMLSASSSRLEDVVVTDNTAVYGGGLYAYDSSPTLVRCTLSHSTSSWEIPPHVPRGGGVHAVDSDLTMVDCVVHGNGEVSHGGGVCLEASGGTVSLVMTGGEISGNTAREHGAGLSQISGTAHLSRVAVHGNTRSAAATLTYGGGLSFTAATVTADSLTVTDNTAQVGAGISGQNCPDVLVTGTVLAGNTADFVGGALFFQNCTTAAVTGNTIVANTGTGSGAGGIYVLDSAVTLTGSIVVGNNGGTNLANGVGVATGSVTATCADVWGNAGADWSGVADPTGSDGNVAVDPLLCDVDGRDFSLGAASPCDPANSGGCGLIGAVGETCAASSVGDDDVPAVFGVAQNFPNPFNPGTMIRFALPEPGRIQVTIFDVRGRRVVELLDQDLAAGVHEADWNGRDLRGRAVATGVYFYEVVSGDQRAVGRMALVR